MGRLGKAPVVVLAAIVVASILIGAVALGIRRAAEKGAERGAQREIGRRLDSADGALYGGGTQGPDADAYKASVSFLEIQGTPLQDSAKVVLSGTVRNAGPWTVTYLKVRFALLDRDGVQVATGTGYVAHGLTAGENNFPADPNSSRRFFSVVDNVPSDWDWTPGAVKCVIEEIAIK